MSDSSAPSRLALYWRLWLALLALTLTMVVLDGSALPIAVLAGVLIVVMLSKASLIAGFFMHLRYEGMLLVLSFVLGLLVLGSILYVLMIPDGHRILEMVRALG